MGVNLYNAIEKLKPVLVRIIPSSFLQKVKEMIVKKNFNNSYKKIDHCFRREFYPDGINLIGSIKACHGLGQSCRLVANELEHAEIPICIYDFDLNNHLVRMDDTTYDDRIKDTLEYNINLIHINPYEFCYSYFRVKPEFWSKRYNIGFWLWELEEFPEHWKLALKGLDEIWTPSEFISRNLRKITELPVKTIPYHVTAPVDNQYGRQYFNLPEDKFLFLMMYDSNSTMERKNPLGVIEAFKCAFSNGDEKVGLVIKINNYKDEDISLIKDKLEGYSNIYILTESYEKIQVNTLIQCVDVLVSLHRAEGFGLVMAEAMLVGTPVIATNYSSNTEFMNKDVACMVEYEMTSVKSKNSVYPIGARWAEPDIKEAAGYMQRLYEDQEYYNKLSNYAKIYIKEKLSLKSAVSLIDKRVREIYEMEGSYI